MIELENEFLIHTFSFTKRIDGERKNCFFFLPSNLLPVCIHTYNCYNQVSMDFFLSNVHHF